MIDSKKMYLRLPRDVVVWVEWPANTSVDSLELVAELLAKQLESIQAAIAAERALAPSKEIAEEAPASD